jgi:hypothetical protein
MHISHLGIAIAYTFAAGFTELTIFIKHLHQCNTIRGERKHSKASSMVLTSLNSIRLSPSDAKRQGDSVQDKHTVTLSCMLRQI